MGKRVVTIELFDIENGNMAREIIEFLNNKYDCDASIKSQYIKQENDIGYVEIDSKQLAKEQEDFESINNIDDSFLDAIFDRNNNIVKGTLIK